MHYVLGVDNKTAVDELFGWVGYTTSTSRLDFGVVLDHDSDTGNFKGIFVTVAG